MTIVGMCLATQFVSGCNNNGPFRGNASEGARPYFTDMVYGNNYNKHVRFQTFNDTTYITFSGTIGNEPLIWSVNHESNQWTGPVRVGSNQIGDDMHGNPSMLVDDDGYIHVWYGSHGATTSDKVYARSKNPEDITQWIHPDFETDITYPAPTLMSDNTVVVFYRAGNHSMPGSDAWVIRRSEDNGVTWSDPRVLLQKMSPDSTADLYAVPTEYPGEDKIGIGISDEFLPGSATRHSTSHLFYVVYNLAEDEFYNVEGQKLEAPEGLSIEQLRQNCLIADYDEMGNYNRRVSARPSITADGRVYILAPNGNPEGFAERPEDFDSDSHTLPDYADGSPGYPPNYGELTYEGKPRIWRWDDGQWQSQDPAGDIQAIYTSENDLFAWDRINSSVYRLLRNIEHGQDWDPVDEVHLRPETNTETNILINAGHRRYHPYAEAIIYERDVESTGRNRGEARAWLWGENGITGPKRPLSERVPSTSAGLDLIEAELQIAKKGKATYSLSIPNHYLTQTLDVEVEVNGDHGKQWKMEDLPASRTIPSGHEEEVLFVAEPQDDGGRYPLPELKITLSTTDADGERVTSTASRLIPEENRPVLKVDRCETPPRIDGSLEDPLWGNDPDIPVFGRKDRGRALRPGTSAWLRYDSDALYVAVRCEEQDTDSLRLRSEKRDDNVWQDDSIEILVDPEGEGENHCQVVVNAEGIIRDQKRFDADVDFEGLRAAAQIHEGRAWTAEVALPWKDIGLDAPPENATVLLVRNRQVGGKRQMFQFPVSPKSNHHAEFFAPLELQREQEN
ncbi:MAG: BNR-4 repeat-containing protein [Planctomycetota bacterium]